MFLVLNFLIREETNPHRSSQTVAVCHTGMVVAEAIELEQVEEKDTAWRQRKIIVILQWGEGRIGMGNGEKVGLEIEEAG